MQMLTAMINGHVIRVTLDEWTALRKHGPTSELLSAITLRLKGGT